MDNSRRILPLLITLIFILVFANPALPQASTGSVKGTVQDVSNAVLPKAAVELTNIATNVTSRTTTNDAGVYLFLGVVPGQYRLTVEAAGFERFEGLLTVQVQQNAVVDPVLNIGQTATTIEVQDVTPLVQAESPSLGRVLERSRIEQLPINGRNIQNLLWTVPGMEANSRAYGIRQGAHVLVFDGTQQNEVWEGFDQQRPPGLDAIQEFRVEANNSSAKYTRPTTVLMSSRSGTNEFHGSAFETTRNNAIGKARQRQDVYSKAPLNIRNEFGVSAGGPVFLPRLYDGRNRTFWFFAYEANRSTAPRTLSWRVPTQAMRNGDFSGLVDAQNRLIRIYDPLTTDSTSWQRQPFSYNGRLNVIDPARQSPVAKYLYDITPLPTLPTNPLVDVNWIGESPNWFRGYTTSTRFDHRFSDVDHFYARYTHSNATQLYQYSSQVMLNEVPGAVLRRAPNKSLALSWVHTFSPTLFNELLVSGTRDLQYRGNGDGVTKYADLMGLPNPFNMPGWPQITGTGLPNYSFNADPVFGIPYNYFILQDNATKIYGRHEFQFGFHTRYDQLTSGSGISYTSGLHDFSTLGTALYDPNTGRVNPQATALTGSDAANMYLGMMNYGVRFGRPNYYFRSHEYAGYFQDNIKVNRRLTLNLGLRYEFRPPIREKNNVMVGFDMDRHAIVLGTELDTMYRLGAALPSVVDRLSSQGAKFITYQDAGLPQSLIHTNKKDFGPRVGFAYQAGDTERPWIIRGGYRVSYFMVPLASWASNAALSAPMYAQFATNINSAAMAPDGIPNYGMRSTFSTIAGVNSRDAININNASLLSRGFATLSFLDPDQPDGRVQDWNLTLEHEIIPNTVAKVSYVGNHVDNLEQQFRLNETTPAYIWYATRGIALPGGEYSAVATRPYDQQVYGDLNRHTKSGWSNFNGIQLEIERRYNKGFAYQLFYVMSNALGAGGKGWNSPVNGTNLFMPDAVPQDEAERSRFLTYQRDTTIPKHAVRWNWLVDLPIGKGKWLAKNSSGLLDAFIGGWQVAGMGSLVSTYFTLPTNIYPTTGQNIEVYGDKYPIEDCRSGICYPGYLWWNGYIPANQINSYNAAGKPNGIMGVPAEYKPAGEPLIPWPAQPNSSDPMYPFYGTNTVWVPMQNGSTTRIVFNDNLHPWRNQYLSSVRQWGLDASLFKQIRVSERFSVRFNADFFNILNHPNNPNSVGADGVLSTRNSGSAARQTQLTLRLIW